MGLGRGDLPGSEGVGGGVGDATADVAVGVPGDARATGVDRLPGPQAKSPTQPNIRTAVHISHELRTLPQPPFSSGAHIGDDYDSDRQSEHGKNDQCPAQNGHAYDVVLVAPNVR